MKQWLAKILFIAFEILGINIVFRLLNAGKLRILMYHGVTSRTLPTFYWTQLHLNRFVSQMEILSKQYNVVSAESLLSQASDRLSYPRNAVVITFDDGYENIFNEAAPVLLRFGLPATVFVVTGVSQSAQLIWADLVYAILIRHSDEQIDLTAFGLEVYPKSGDRSRRAIHIERLKNSLKTFSDDERRAVVEYLLEKYPLEDEEIVEVLRLMSADQIVELSKTGNIGIASHSHNHPILSTLSAAEQQKEIELSLCVLDSWKIPHSGLFAYPNGRPQDYNENTITALKNAGIRAAVTTSDGFYDRTDGPYWIKRIPVGAEMDRWEFKARLSGAYYFLRRITGTRCA